MKLTSALGLAMVLGGLMPAPVALAAPVRYDSTVAGGPAL